MLLNCSWRIHTSGGIFRILLDGYVQYTHADHYITDALFAIKKTTLAFYGQYCVVLILDLDCISVK